MKHQVDEEPLDIQENKSFAHVLIFALLRNEDNSVFDLISSNFGHYKSLYQSKNPFVHFLVRLCHFVGRTCQLFGLQWLMAML